MAHNTRTQSDSTWLVGAPVWQASHGYSTGILVVPSVADGFMFECTSSTGSHLSGVTEPAWVTGLGNTTTDNALVWTCVALPAGYTIPPTDWQSLDRKVFQAVNGVDGGTWAPGAAITIDGTQNLQVNAPCRADYGGGLMTAGNSRFTLNAYGASNDIDWPSFAPGHARRTRTIVQSLIKRHARPQYFWQTSMQYPGSVQSMMLGVFGTLTAPSDTSFFSYLRVHDGSTLSQVTVNFRVPTPRSAQPRITPIMRVMRTTITGANSGLTVPLTSTAAGAVDTFVVVKRPASGDLWYNNGQPQSLVIPCDQNNVIDCSQYVYWIQIFEESGSVYPTPVFDGITRFEQKLDVAFATNPSDTQWTARPTGAYTIDGGHTCLNGERVLIKDGTGANAVWNGIWNVNLTGSTVWSRADDCSQVGSFTQNWWVNVPYTAGSGAVVNSGSQWECTGPSVLGKANIAISPISQAIFPWPTFARRAARGNIYHSAVMKFTGITNMRWQ